MNPCIIPIHDNDQSVIRGAPGKYGIKHCVKKASWPTRMCQKCDFSVPGTRLFLFSPGWLGKPTRSPDPLPATPLERSAKPHVGGGLKGGVAWLHGRLLQSGAQVAKKRPEASADEEKGGHN